MCNCTPAGSWHYAMQQPYPVYPAPPQPMYPYAYQQPNPYRAWADYSGYRQLVIKDNGPAPYVVNIERVTEYNDNYRTALWTGEHLQVTLMSIPVGGDIGLELHPDTDQFIRVEDGRGVVQMGDRKDNLNFQQPISDDTAIMIPAGKWHNVINTGHEPLKLYSIYAPPHHPQGTVHRTKAEAQAAEAAVATN